MAADKLIARHLRLAWTAVLTLKSTFSIDLNNFTSNVFKVDL